MCRLIIPLELIDFLIKSRKINVLSAHRVYIRNGDRHAISFYNCNPRVRFSLIGFLSWSPELHGQIEASVHATLYFY